MATEAEIADELKKRYPTYAYVVDSVPEIRNLLVQAKQAEDAGQAWPEDELMAKMQNTNWWRSTGNQVKLWQELKYNSPGEADTQRREREAALWDITRRTGVTISPEAVQALADQSLSFGWDTNSPQLIDALATMAQYNPGVGKEPTGLGSTMQSIKEMADAYMIRVGDQDAFNMARQVMAGELEQDALKVTFAEQAKGKFAHLTPYIERGITPRQYFAPHVQELAAAWEVSSDSINLMDDPRLSQVIGYADPQSKEIRPMTISEVQRLARSDDRWRSTRQGQETAAKAAEGILSMFGKVAS